MLKSLKSQILESLAEDVIPIDTTASRYSPQPGEHVMDTRVSAASRSNAFLEQCTYFIVPLHVPRLLHHGSPLLQPKHSPVVGAHVGDHNRSEVVTHFGLLLRLHSMYSGLFCSALPLSVMR